MNLSARNDVVLENLPLVGYLVSEACGKSRYLSRDDLASAGSVALIQCANTFDSTLGVPFASYARFRIRGAIIDEMRRQDWATRSARRRMTATSRASEALTAQLGRTPSVDELSLVLGVGRDAIQDALDDSARTVVSLDETVESILSDGALGPEDAVLVAETLHHLRQAIAVLPENMRNIIEQVYLEDRPVKDVAAELGISHAAVSQHRAEAIRLLRDGMNVGRTEDTEPEQTHSRIAPHRVENYRASVAAHTAGGITRAKTPVMV